MSKNQKIIKYLAEISSREINTEIKEIGVESETDKSVKWSGRVHRKRSSWYNFFDTREEAVAFLISEQKKLIDQNKEKMEYLKARNEKFKETLKTLETMQ